MFLSVATSNMVATALAKQVIHYYCCCCCYCYCIFFSKKDWWIAEYFLFFVWVSEWWMRIGELYRRVWLVANVWLNACLLMKVDARGTEDLWLTPFGSEITMMYHKPGWWSMVIQFVLCESYDMFVLIYNLCVMWGHCSIITPVMNQPYWLICVIPLEP